MRASFGRLSSRGAESLLFIRNSVSHHVPMRAFLHRVKMTHSGNVENAIGRCRGGADRAAEIDSADNFLFLARGEYPEIAAPRAHVNFTIRHHWRGPHVALNLVGP